MTTLAEVILYDTRANQPAASTAGALYYVTDEGVLERANGSTWDQIAVSDTGIDFGETGDITTLAFAGAAAAGATGEVADAGHSHGMPADPVTAHVALTDPHTGYIKESEFSVKGDLIVGTGSNTLLRLGIGSASNTIIADATQTTGMRWGALPSGDITTDAAWAAKGDLIVGTGNDTAAVLSVGSASNVIIADATQATGMRWGTVPGALTNPMTTAEDIIKGGVAGAPDRLALGASNTALASSNSTLAYVKVAEATFAPDSLNASAAPSASNDFTQGWRRGSRWIDTVANKEYVCLDEATGAAVWTETTQSGGGTFDPDEHIPWQVLILPQAQTPDTTVGTWSVFAIANEANTYGLIQPGAANVGAAAFHNSTAAQNDEAHWNVVLAAGTWVVRFLGRKSTNTGIITCEIDGSSVGTIDTYAASPASLDSSISGITVASTGKHTVGVLMATKNASSSAYLVWLAGISLRRTA